MPSIYTDEGFHIPDIVTASSVIEINCPVDNIDKQLKKLMESGKLGVSAIYNAYFAIRRKSSQNYVLRILGLDNAIMEAPLSEPASVGKNLSYLIGFFPARMPQHSCGTTVLMGYDPSTGHCPNCD